MTIPAGNYPKMAFAADPATGRIVNLVYPPGHAKQGLYVLFGNKNEETAYDGTGINASLSPSVHENKHHN